MKVTALLVYPVKACGPVALARADVGRRGFRHDRRFMVVDEHGRFVSQREEPGLVLVRCTADASHFELTAPGRQPLRIPHAPTDGARASVQVWSATCEALVHELGSEWFSALLSRPVRLVYMPDDVERPASGDAGASHIVSFADGYPFLLTTQASLADLNGRLDAPIEMLRFRPNIVVDGVAPFEEDDWGSLRIGDIGFTVTKGCDRCSVTTVDLVTGKRHKEPLRTLATYRQWDGKVWFGVNLVATSGGTMSVGDPVHLD